MQTRPDVQLLQDYALNREEAAFRELVNRHTNLVYSAALRQVESATVASDLAQQVFTDLARKAEHIAGELSSAISLAGWLHRATRYAVLQHLRATRRRMDNERLAMEQLLTDSTPDADWEQIRPILDHALDQLEPEDREILLLRYFQNQDFRTVGAALGISDDTAQKRASRAVEHLRELFARQGVSASAGGLGLIISANAIQAAPLELATQISTAALASTAATATTITLSQTIAMTTLQKIVITTTIAALAGVGFYENRQAARLREQNQMLQQQQSATASQLQRLQREHDDATNRISQLASELAAAQKRPEEVLKLRGQVGQLRQQAKAVGETSALNKITANPETRKLLRDQQKAAMSQVYADLTKQLKLTPEQTGKFNDLLADSIMDNVDLITQILHDGKTPAEADRLFTAADATLLNQLGSELGEDGRQQYQEYTRNLASSLTLAQFSGFLTGSKGEIQDKKNQLYQTLQAAAANVRQSAGLSAEYQLVPMLNFRNIASETTGNQSLELLDNIYQQVAANSQSYLTVDELASLQTFRTNAVNVSRLSLTMNRKMMAPLSQ